jgi:hypothetical protein
MKLSISTRFLYYLCFSEEDIISMRGLQFSEEITDKPRSSSEWRVSSRTAGEASGRLRSSPRERFAVVEAFSLV